MADQRTFDAVRRHDLPYPISVLYHQRGNAITAVDQLGFTRTLVEGVLRFLALCGLAEVVGKGASRKFVGECCRCLENPGAGKLLGLLRKCTRWLVDTSDPFLAEMSALVSLSDEAGAPPEWEQAVAFLIDDRNYELHQLGHTEEPIARELLKQLEAPLQTMLTGVHFLQSFRLGVLEHISSTTHGHSYRWFGCTGLQERCCPLELETESVLLAHWVMLVDLRRELGMYLTPFFHWGAPAERAQTVHLMWLLEIDPATKQPLFKQPWLLYTQRPGFANPHATERPAHTATALGEEVQRWQQPRVQLPAPFCERLRAPFGPLAFGEKWEVRGTLGEGGMGVVFEATDRTLRRRVALKVIRPELGLADDVRQRFLAEARALAEVSDPLVVQVYEAGLTDSGAPFLAMEYVEGQDLESWVKSGGVPPFADAVAVFRQAMAALDALHRHRIVHRDVKPSNFVRTAAGVKILDLGIALSLDTQRHTAAPDLMGTRGYLAPEQEGGTATIASDVFASGRVLFFLLAGRTPVDDREQPTDAAPGVPRDLDVVYGRATALRAEERFATARELGEAVAAVLPGHRSAPTEVVAAGSLRDDVACALDLLARYAALPVAALAAGCGLAPGRYAQVEHELVIVHDFARRVADTIAITEQGRRHVRDLRRARD